MFDGSSISGWKGINESDMVLMPDPATAVIDPFAAHKTLLLQCDVLEPTHDAGLCARSALGRQARRGVSEIDRHRRHRVLRSGARVLHLRFGAFPERHGPRRATRSIRKKARGRRRKKLEGGNSGQRPGVKGGYFPVPPVDSFQDLRSEMCKVLEACGMIGRSASPRSRERGPVRDRHAVQRRWSRRPTS